MVKHFRLVGLFTLKRLLKTTNKLVNQLVWNCFNLTKVFYSKLEIATAL